jgi:D-alanine-D-alanine ligase
LALDGPRLAVAFNDDAHLKPHLNPTELIGEAEVGETAREIVALTGATPVPVRDDIPAALARLREFDVVINLCEGVLGRPQFEKNFALALEMAGIRHTSGDPISVGICGDKALTKRLLDAGGLPVPRGFADPTEAELARLRFPVIVKPAREDAGVGIEPASVAHTPAQARVRCAHVRETYRQPALAEEFIDGAELNQALFHGRHGLVLLPPGEVCFAADLPAHERLVGWKAKWDAGSAEDLATVNRTPALISDDLRDEIGRICTAAVELLGIRGYCRFDLRQAGTGQLFLIDVNPNPDIGAGTGFRKALQAAGIPFREFLNELMIAAA